MGGLNYRLEVPSYESIKQQIENKEYESIFKYEQLVLEKKAYRFKITRLQKSTYSFSSYFQNYDNSNYFCIDKNDHIPAWTDRILFKCLGITIL